MSGRRIDGPAQKVHESVLTLPGTPTEVHDQWSFALAEIVQQRRYRIDRFEPDVAIGAGADFARSLGAAQQHDGQSRELVIVEAQRFIENVFVFVGAARGDTSAQLVGSQFHHRLDDLTLAVVGYRLAICLLIAGVDERVGGQRILVGRRRPLLYQAAQDSNFYLCQFHPVRPYWSAERRARTAPEDPRWNGNCGAPSNDIVNVELCARGYPRGRMLVRFVRIVGAFAALVLLLAACSAEPALDLSPTAAEGREITLSSGCAACHGRNGEGGVAPTWQGLAGSTVSFTDLTTTVADAEYLANSIADPSSQLRAGFNLKMPQNSLTDEQIDLVVAYIQELK